MKRLAVTGFQYQSIRNNSPLSVRNFGILSNCHDLIFQSFPHFLLRRFPGLIFSKFCSNFFSWYYFFKNFSNSESHGYFEGGFCFLFIGSHSKFRSVLKLKFTKKAFSDTQVIFDFRTHLSITGCMHTDRQF